MIGYLTVEQLRDKLAEYPEHSPVAVVADVPGWEGEMWEEETGQIELGWSADGVVELRVSL